jgi:hypothetical protein
MSWKPQFDAIDEEGSRAVERAVERNERGCTFKRGNEFLAARKANCMACGQP